MSAHDGPPEIAVLRMQLDRNRRLKLEFQAAVSALLRMYDVEVSDELIGRLTLAVSEELPGEGNTDLGTARRDAQSMPHTQIPPDNIPPAPGSMPPQPPSPSGGTPPQPPKPPSPSGGTPPQPPKPPSPSGGAPPQPPKRGRQK